MKPMVIVIMLLALLVQGASAENSFSANDRIWTTSDINLNVREEPGTSAPIVDSVAKGSIGTIIEAPVNQDNYTWWRISYDMGATGWSAGDWLQLAPASAPSQPVDFSSWAENAITWAEKYNDSRDWWDSERKIGYCLRFVANAFLQEKGEGRSGSESAIEAAKKLYRFNQEPGGWQNAPRGAVIFFDGEGNNDYGHVGIYLGDGRLIHAYGSVQETTIEEAMDKPDVGRYLGWSYPPEEWRPTSTPVAAEAPLTETQTSAPTNEQKNAIQESIQATPPLESVNAAQTSGQFAAPQETNDILGTWIYTHQINGGIYSHKMIIDDFDPDTGTFKGHGWYLEDPSYRWDLSGAVNGNNISFCISYTVLSPTFGINATGEISSDTFMRGEADEPGGRAIWTATKSSIIDHPNWDITGGWEVNFQADRLYPHKMIIESFNPNTGDFKGHGQSLEDPAIIWDISGTVDGDNVAYHIAYTGLNPTYWADAIGIISSGTTMSGTANDHSRSSTWNATKS
jgi:cell wall-associated NlpC family hydrolase